MIWSFVDQHLLDTGYVAGTAILIDSAVVQWLISCTASNLWFVTFLARLSNYSFEFLASIACVFIRSSDSFTVRWDLHTPLNIRQLSMYCIQISLYIFRLRPY